jgi:molybdate transport system substrate-binding protein
MIVAPFTRGTILLGLSALLSTREAGAQGSDPKSDITVFAAASLTAAFQELAGAFERAHPGTRVRLNFAGSQQLALQLEQGAEADVFASADGRWMAHVAQRNLLNGAPRVFAHNRLAVIVPAANPAGIERLQDLSRRGVKIVLAAEAVPVGAYSRQALRKLARAQGFPPDFGRRVLANVVSEEENVKAVVAKVQLGEADAGMVYASDAIGSVARELTVLEVPDAQNVRADYPVAVLRGARSPAAAAAFVELVLGATGQAVLTRHGLTTASGTD